MVGNEGRKVSVDSGDTIDRLAGQVFAIFVIAIAAAEAAVGLSLIISIYRNRKTVNLDELDMLKG